MIRKLVLITMTIVCLLCPPVEANQHSVTSVKKTIVKNSIELGIDPALALSIAKSESGFKHDSRSHNGAVGVFQLMPSTARRLGINPYYMSDNVKGGLMYYKRMYNMFGSTELALAAYNAGPAVVKKYKRVPPYGETKRFVSGIMTEYNRQKSHPDPEIARLKSQAHKNNYHGSNAAYSMKKTSTKSQPAKTLANAKSTSHVVLKENTKLMKKTLAKEQNVKFVIVTKG